MSKAIPDLQGPGGSLNLSETDVTLTTTEAINKGQVVVCIPNSDGSFTTCRKTTVTNSADAGVSVSGTATSHFVGVAMHDAASGALLKVRLRGPVEVLAYSTNGTPQILADNALVCSISTGTAGVLDANVTGATYANAKIVAVATNSATISSATSTTTRRSAHFNGIEGWGRFGGL